MKPRVADAGTSSGKCRRRRTGLIPTLSLATITVAGCEDGFFHPPAAPEAASVALTYRLATAGVAGGPGNAFDQATQIRLTVVSVTSSETLLDSVEPFEATGQETRISLPVEIDGTSEEASLSIVLSSAQGPLFSGQSRVTLTRGQSTEADVPLEGVAAGLRIDQDVPTMVAIGQTQTVGGVTLFSTGDTLGPVPITLQSLAPGVVTASGSQITAVGEGTAGLVGSFGALSDQTSVTVSLEVVAVDLDPLADTVLIGEEALFTAMPRDANGNPISGRTVVWSSTDPTVASVDANGAAVGLALGTVQIMAEVDGISGTGRLVVRADRPKVATGVVTDIELDGARIRGQVIPGGAPTTAWFEWDTDPGFSDPVATTPVDVGGGTEPVNIAETLTGLTPQTLYYFRVVAENVAGTGTSGGTSFATPPRAPTDLGVKGAGGEPPILSISWAFVGGPVDFHVDRMIENGPWLEWVVSPVQSIFDLGAFGVQYSYRVRACFEGSCSGYSNVASIRP